MWNDEKQRWFDALRLKEAQGALSNAEAQKLQEFLLCNEIASSLTILAMTIFFLSLRAKRSNLIA